jgi:RNA polymerase sigma-70 factor (ECF subfamily)
VIAAVPSQRARFEALVLAHLDAAYRLARWLAPSASDADDVVQEAVLRAYRGFSSLRGTDAKPWLLAIVRNCHWTAARARRVYVQLPDEDVGDYFESAATADDNPETAILQAEAGHTLDALIAALRPDYREVLVLREIEELSYRDIATVVGLPIGTVMSRLSRARAALQRQWLGGTTGAAREPS